MLLAPLLALLQAAEPKPVEALPPLVQFAQAVSPDHKRIAISTRDEGVWVLDVASRTVAFRVPPTTSVVEYLTWSNDSAKLGLLHRNADIEIVNATTGNVTAKMGSTSKNPVEWDKREIHFAAGGTVVIAALGGPPTDVFGCADGERIAQISHGNDFYATAMALSRDGTLLALGTHEGAVRIWEAASGRSTSDTITVPLAKSRRIRSLDFDAKGEELAIASGDCRIRLWKPATEATPRSFSFCGPDVGDLVVDCVRFSRDGTRLVATASPDWFLNVWSANTGLQLASYYFGSSEGRALEAWFCADSGVACISAGLVAVNTTDTDHTTDVKLPHPITTWCSDGDYAWAVVDHHLVVRKVPDAQPVLRVAVREK